MIDRKNREPPQVGVPKTKISSLAELAERNVKLKRRSTDQPAMAAGPGGKGRDWIGVI